MSGGTRERTAIEAGIERLLGDGQDLREGQVGERPLLRQQRGVALDQRGARERPIAVGEVLPVQAVEVEVLVLEGVGVLVGQRHALERPEGAAALDDGHLIALVVVVAEHLVAEQLELGGGQVGSGGKKPSRSPRRAWHGVLLGRCRFGDEALQIGSAARPRRRCGPAPARRLELADGRHRRLGLRDERLELGRARGLAPGSGWAGVGARRLTRPPRLGHGVGDGDGAGLETAQAAASGRGHERDQDASGGPCWRGVGLASANRRRPGWRFRPPEGVGFFTVSAL